MGRGQGAAAGAGLLSGPRRRNAAPGPLSKASRTPCRAALSSSAPQHHQPTAEGTEHMGQMKDAMPLSTAEQMCA